MQVRQLEVWVNQKARACLYKLPDKSWVCQWVVAAEQDDTHVFVLSTIPFGIAEQRAPKIRKAQSPIVVAIRSDLFEPLQPYEMFDMRFLWRNKFSLGLFAEGSP